MLMDVEFIMPLDVHKQIVQAAFEKRGYTEKESSQAADFSEQASWHGIKTHNALKALHLDHLFGSVVGGCVPGAEVEVLSTSFDAVQAWNGHKKLGQALAYDAMDACIEMADRHGSGIVMIDEAFHYLWGGGYVIDVAKKGYIAYTQCTAALAEVVPFMGKFPTLGTNPHSWAFRRRICWAIPFVSIGPQALWPWVACNRFCVRVGHFLLRQPWTKRVMKTRNPADVASLLPFGAHKGYGLGLING